MKRQIILGCSLAVMLLAGCGGKMENFRTAEQALKEGNYQLALENYQECITADTRTQKSCRGAGIAEMNLKNYEEAVRYFNQAMIGGKLSDTLKRDITQYLATAYYHMGDYSNAMASCQDLMAYPMNAQSYFISGMTALALNAYDEAERNFRNAYLQDGSYEMAFRIYNAYREKGMYANSTEYLERALEIEPSSGDDYSRRGRCYYYMEQYPEALEELKIAVEKGSMEAYLVMGEIYQLQGDLAEARSMYQEYISGEGPSARGYNGLAMCDITEGKYDSALANVRSGITCADLSIMPDLLFNEVVIYEKMLDFETAYEKIQGYTERYPEDPEGQKEELFLQSRLQEAAQTSSRTERIAAEAEESEEVYDESTEDFEEAYDDSGYDAYGYDPYGYDYSGYNAYGYYDTYGYYGY